MLTLSIKQPHAHLILAGVKLVENRTWPTNHRGRLAIHASAQPDGRSWSSLPDSVLAYFQLPDEPIDPRLPVEVAPRRGQAFVLPPFASLVNGAIVGSVEVYDCLEELDLPDDLLFSDPFVAGPWVWLLRDPRPLAVPYPCPGRLRLWEAPAGLRLP